eukprot:3757705-Rhodomonas_salina.2
MQESACAVQKVLALSFLYLISRCMGGHVQAELESILGLAWGLVRPVLGDMPKGAPSEIFSYWCASRRVFADRLGYAVPCYYAYARPIYRV